MESNKDKNSTQQREKRPFKGIILDGKVYRAVRTKEFFRMCNGCDVGRDGLCPEGSLGAWLCNAFSYAYAGVPVRFRFSPTLTETLKNMQNL